MTTRQASVTKSTADKYEIRSESGDHATIYLESGQHTKDLRTNGGWGRITIQSSFGAFATYWNSCGNDFPHFLTSLDFDYTMKNLRNYQHRVFDNRGTMECVQQTILQDRRKCELSKDDAKKAWEAVAEAEEYTDGTLFLAHLMDSGLDFYEDVHHWAPRQKYHSECTGFWEHIWPLFIAEITKPSAHNPIECVNRPQEAKIKLPPLTPERIRELALENEFTLKDINAEGHPDLRPYVYNFAAAVRAA